MFFFSSFKFCLNTSTNGHEEEYNFAHNIDTYPTQRKKEVSFVNLPEALLLIFQKIS